MNRITEIAIETNKIKIQINDTTITINEIATKTIGSRADSQTSSTNVILFARCANVVSMRINEMTMNKVSLIFDTYVRVRGFPARDILSLCALGDGIGQDNKIVGASSSSSSSASFSSVLGLVRKSYTK